MPEANPTWWLNYVYGTQRDGREEHAGFHPVRRRLIMHRWGGLGNQRYPIGFSGDTASSWASLAFQPLFTSAAANVNFGYWSHDIGGFYEPCEPELYVRWVQFGAFSPIFRSHGFRATNIEKRFWMFGDVYFGAMRAALRLRLELLPHLYSAARVAFDGGPSPIRPLYHEWPTLDAAYDHPNQYLFGRGMVVAPVTKRRDADAPLARGVQMWVPPGVWVLAHAGVAIDGPRMIELAVALDEIPLLVQSGTWLFGMAPPEAEWDHCSGGLRGWLGRAQRVPRCPQAALWLAGDGETAAREGRAELYEDDGWSTQYRHGNSSTARTTLSHRYVRAAASSDTDELHVSIHAVRGCLHAVAPEAFDEPGQPRSCGHATSTPQQPRTRSWRLLLHGVPPPASGSVRGADGKPDTPIRFVDPPTAERRRRADDRSEPIWFFDAERLCVVVWLFDLPPTTHTELVLAFGPRTTTLATQVVLPLLPLRRLERRPAAIGAVGAMRRAQAAKALLDATYPETQPQDYDQATWLAGLGTRIAARPANYSKEMAALPALIRAARAQLVAEPTRRVSPPLNSERVRNATALVVEAGAK